MDDVRLIYDIWRIKAWAKKNDVDSVSFDFPIDNIVEVTFSKRHNKQVYKIKRAVDIREYWSLYESDWFEDVVKELNDGIKKGGQRMKKYVVEETFEYLDYECKIVFQDIGHRCGYIKIPKDHPFYDQDYNFCNRFMDCHGGLTYDSNYLCDEECEDGEWIGFDCGHCYDGLDLEATKEYFPGRYSDDWYETMKRLNECSVVRTKEFCEEELKRLALQLETARNILEYFNVNVKEDK